MRSEKGSNYTNATTLWRDREGRPVTVGALRGIFEKYSDQRVRQFQIAFASIFDKRVDHNLVVSMIPDEDTKLLVRNWCEIRGLTFKDQTADKDNPRYKSAEKLLEQDQYLLDILGPLVSQVDQARILQRRHFIEASETESQILISSFYRTLSDVLGPRRVFKGEPPRPSGLPLPEIPIELFRDDLVRNILWESEREAVLAVFNRDKEEGFRYLQTLKENIDHPLKQNFIESLEEHFRKADALIVPGFKSEIAGSQKDVPEEERGQAYPFPSLQQKEFAYRFITKPIGMIDLLVADVRTRKSAQSLYAMKAAGAKTTLVVGPAINKPQWEAEIKDVYEEEVRVVRIDSQADFEKILAQSEEGIPRPTHVVLSYSFLSGIKDFATKSGLVGFDVLKTMVNKLQIDSLIADESHYAVNPDASCSNELFILSSLLPKEAPRIAMTATQLVNTIEDFDMPMRILMPHRYPNEGDFTRAARNNPAIISDLFHGQKILTRITRESVFGDRLPKVTTSEVPVPLSLYHHLLYQFVYEDDSIEGSQKRGLLRQVALDPNLVRRQYHPSEITKKIDNLRASLTDEKDERKAKITGERIRAFQERLNKVINLGRVPEVISDLKSAYKTFLEWKKRGETDEFNENFLIKMGYEKSVLFGFIYLDNGLTDLIRSFDDESLIDDWKGKGREVSSIYERLFEDLDQLKGHAKVIIYSGFYQDGVTTGIEDQDPNSKFIFESLYDRLRERYGDESFEKMDQTVSINSRNGNLSEREKIRRSFRTNPVQWGLLATSRSASTGYDLTIPPTDANKDFEKVVVIHLDSPDTYKDKVQMLGRVQGEGQEIPIELLNYHTTHPEQPNTLRYGFIGHEITRSVEFKRLLACMVLDNVSLTPDEQEFVTAYMTHIRLITPPLTPRHYLLTRFFREFRGKGYEHNKAKFEEESGFEGMTNKEFFAAYYVLNDEFSGAGYNAKAVAEIIKKFRLGRRGEEEDLMIASIGAGAGILQLTLGESIVNVDMLPDILQAGRDRQFIEGDYITGDAARLPLQSEVFDVTDASHVINWSRNEPVYREPGLDLSERALMLSELNRITKMGGLVTISLPHTHLNRESFVKWENALGLFGFKLSDRIGSGLLRATDFRVEPISWVFNLEKVRTPTKKELAQLHTEDLKLDFEPLVDIIEPGLGRLPGDITIDVKPPVPHSSFEIANPGTNTTEEFEYSAPEYEIDINGIRVIPKRPIDDRIAVLTELGIQEEGIYYRLAKRARNRYHLSRDEAEKVSLEALKIWSESALDKHDYKRIWSDVRLIMDMTIKEKPDNAKN